MAGAKEWASKWASRIFLFVHVCIVIAVCIIGTVVAVEVSGSPYYYGDGLLSCRAIIFPRDEEGVEINFGTYGGGQIASFGNYSSSSATIAYANQEGGQSVSEVSPAAIDGMLNSSRTFESKSCKLIVPQHPTESRSLIVSASDGKEVEMSEKCGGESPGWWIDGDAEGIWGSPIIACLIVWLGIRSVGFWFEVNPAAKDRFVDLLGDEENKNSCRCWEVFLTKIMPEAFMFILFVWATNILIAPIQNLQAHELCPQLMTTGYSFIVLVVACVSLFPGIVLALWYGTGLFGSKIKADDDQCCKCLVEALLVIWSGAGVLMCALYKGYEAYHWSFSVIFGINIDLTFRYPEFDLSAKLNAFHLLTFVLYLLDVMDLIRKTKKRLSRKKKPVNNDKAVEAAEPGKPAETPPQFAAV